MSKTFETATVRLSRLLTMVPWLLNRQGIDLASAAAQFGVSQDQVVEDLQLLFLCGTPGHLPDDLIEASWDEGRVHIANADTIARPLRLGRDEAVALIVALRALAQVPGVASHDAIDRALAKLESAAGEAARDTEQITVDLSADDERVQRLLGHVREGLERNRRLHLRYLVASRDESTERDVDPMRVLSVEGRWYLEAWCHRSEGVRTFRLDRIEELQVLDEDGTPPEQARPREVTSRMFQAAPDDLAVELLLTPRAAWVADNFPVESAERREDGSTVVVLRTAQPQWVRRLVWRLGGEARVLAPAELAEEVRAGAEDALRGVGDPSHGEGADDGSASPVGT